MKRFLIKVHFLISVLLPLFLTSTLVADITFNPRPELPASVPSAQAPTSRVTLASQSSSQNNTPQGRNQPTSYAPASTGQVTYNPGCGSSTYTNGPLSITMNDSLHGSVPLRYQPRPIQPRRAAEPGKVHVPLHKKPHKIDVPVLLYEPDDSLEEVDRGWLRKKKMVPSSAPRDLRSGVDARASLQQRLENPHLSEHERAIIGTFHDAPLLIDFARETDEQAEKVGTHTLFGRVLRDRARGLRSGSRDPGRVLHEDTNLDPVLVGAFPGLAKMNKFEGNSAQFRLHRELVYTMSEAHDLLSRQVLTSPISQIPAMIFNMSSLAGDVINPLIAFKLSDFCFHLLGAGKMMEELRNHSGVAGGLLNVLDHTVSFLVQLGLDPVGTTVSTIFNTLKLAGSVLGTALVLCEDEVGPLQRDVQHAMLDAAGKFCKQQLHDPGMAVALVTELVATHLLFTGMSELGYRANLTTMGKILQADGKIHAQIREIWEVARKAGPPVQQSFCTERVAFAGA